MQLKNLNVDHTMCRKIERNSTIDLLQRWETMTLNAMINYSYCFLTNNNHERVHEWKVIKHCVTILPVESIQKEFKI